jgi:hypothetical protein
MKFGSSKMAVAFSSPSLGHLKMQGKRLEKLRENTGQILPERKNDPTPPSVGDQSPTRGRAITGHCPPLRFRSAARIAACMSMA